MKKISLVLAVCFLLSAVCLPITADSVSVGNIDPADFYADSVHIAVGAYRYILLQVKQCKTQIDLSAFSLSPEELNGIIAKLSYLEAELFHVKTYYYTYDSMTGWVYSLEPVYTMNEEEYAQALSFMRAQADLTLKDMNRSWSNFEKALYLHDAIAACFSYDTTYMVHDAYQMLLGGSGVCQAYTQWYSYLLDRAGLENDCSYSDQINHVWNLVCIDGTWYHVDVTYDDPIISDYNSGIPGSVMHTYFLISDSKIAADHPGYTDDRSCTSTRFDQAAYRDVKSPIVNANGTWYAIREKAICTYAPVTDSFSSVMPIGDMWFAQYTGLYYMDAFSGLAAVDGRLIYNNTTAVYAFNPATGGTEQLYAPILRAGEQLFGFYVDCDNNVSCYLTADSDSDIFRTVHIYLTAVGDRLYTDIGAGDWFYEAVRYAVERGIMNGTGETSFTPDGKTERAMLVTVLWRMEGKPVQTIVQPFDDVAEGAYYYDAVKWAYSKRIINGRSKTDFAPELTMTREEFATVLYRYAEYKRRDVSARSILSVYADGDKVSDWANDAFSWSNAIGLIQGVDEHHLDPGGSATRAQMAMVMMRFIESGK